MEAASFDASTFSKNHEHPVASEERCSSSMPLWAKPASGRVIQLATNLIEVPLQ